MQSTLLNGVTGNGPGAALNFDGLAANRTFMAKVSGTGAVAATVKVQGSHDGQIWKDLGTYTLSGTTSASDGSAIVGSWPRVRGDVSGISGTGAAVTLTGFGDKV